MKQFKPGDKVQWTHEYLQGRSITFTTRKGVVTGDHEKPDCYLVKFRGKEMGIHRSRLRLESEVSELTEQVIGKKGM